jgi:hypothetical protein
MPEDKLPQRLPSGRSIRSSVVKGIEKQVGKYGEAEQMLDEIKRDADKKLAEQRKRGP